MSRFELQPVHRPGLVSVVIVAGDAAATDACLARVLGVDWPEDKLEIIVVTPPGTTAAKSSDERIRVIPLDAPANLAAARNAGVEAARGAHVAFLALEAVPDGRWLRAAFDAFRLDARAAAVASMVVAPDGTVAYAGSALTALGAPSYLGSGVVAEELEPLDHVGEQHETLFAAQAAFVVDAQAFRWAGGFDVSLDAGQEVVDLGWRMWLHGLGTIFADGSRVTGHAVVSVEGDDEQRIFGSLTMIYKCFDDTRLGNTIAAALLEANRTDAGRAAASRFEAGLGALVDARRKIQASRVVGDTEVMRLFHAPIAELGADSTSDAIQEGMDLGRVMTERHKIAVVTPDVLQARMAGPAIRAWNIALALSREHDVRLASTVRVDLEHPDFEVTRADPGGMRELEAWADVVILQGHIIDMHPWLRNSTKIIVADIYDPFHLEVLEQSRDLDDATRRYAVRISAEVLNEQLARGDFFLCASDKQRDFWLGQLAGVGRVNAAVYDGNENLDHLIAVVPFGLDDQPPKHTKPVLKGVVPGIGPDDKVILWGGGVYNWFDPLTLVRAVDRLRARIPEVRLYFMGMKHPNPNVPTMRMAADTQRIAHGLGLVDSVVFFNEGWVDYDDRQNYLLESDIGVSTHLDHVETAFSFRTRILDYLWASLPVVATAGDSFADLIDRRGLGIVVPPNDVDALEEALYDLLVDDERREACGKAATAILEDFRWTRALEPVLEFCRSPRRAADLVDPRQRMMIGDPIAQAMWGQLGWKHNLSVMVDHLKNREYQDLARKVKMRARTMLFPEAAGPGARKEI